MDRKVAAVMSYRNTTIAVLLFVGLFSPLCVAQSECGSISRLANALRLVHALRPDWKNREFEISLGYGGAPFPVDSRGDFYVTVSPSDKVVTKASDHDAEKKDDESVSFQFSFHEDYGYNKRIVHCFPQHVFVDDRTLNSLAEPVKPLLKANWDDESAMRAARLAGLRYGPGDEDKLQKVLPLRGIGKLYGPVKVSKMECRFRSSFNYWINADTTHTSVSMWTIELKETASRRTIRLQVEPFRGQIVAFFELDPTPGP